MRIPHHLQTLLPILLATIPTLALTLPSFDLTLPTLNLTLPTLQNHTLTSEFSCYKGPRLSRQRPKFSDCGGAIRQLNHNNDDGIFHNGGIMNQFQLPVSKYHGTCVVLIDMKEGIKDDEDTWLGVSLVATQLNTVCVGTQSFAKFQGGQTTAGRYDGLRVKLMYQPPGAVERGVEGEVGGS